MATSRKPSLRSASRDTKPLSRAPSVTERTQSTTRAAPDPATQDLLQVLAEDIEDLRGQLKAVRDEMAILRTVVAAQGKVSGGYRRVNED